MSTVAIIGAGSVGGATAYALAAIDRVSAVLLVDNAGAAAAGKALDIQQSGAVDRFHTRLAGTDDLNRIVGCSVCVIADRFGQASVEWAGDEGIALMGRLAPLIGDAPVVFAGPAQAHLLRAAVHENGFNRSRLIGSAPDALASAATGIVALEARCSPKEVQLTVLGAPGRFVIPWSEASIGGYALERVLSQVQLSCIAARVDKLWPPGSYTLGTAAARIAAAIVESSRRSFSALTVLGGEFGVRDRVGALTVRLSPRGIVHTHVPTLNTRERVQVETALGV